MPVSFYLLTILKQLSTHVNILQKTHFCRKRLAYKVGFDFFMFRPTTLMLFHHVGLSDIKNNRNIFTVFIIDCLVSVNDDVMNN